MYFCDTMENVITLNLQDFRHNLAFSSPFYLKSQSSQRCAEELRHFFFALIRLWKLNIETEKFSASKK